GVFAMLAAHKRYRPDHLIAVAVFTLAAAGAYPQSTAPPNSRVRPGTQSDSANARGDQAVSVRQTARRVRASRRSTADLTRVRRALGPALAGRRTLRRFERRG